MRMINCPKCGELTEIIDLFGYCYSCRVKCAKRLLEKRKKRMSENLDICLGYEHRMQSKKELIKIETDRKKYEEIARKATRDRLWSVKSVNELFGNKHSFEIWLSKHKGQYNNIFELIELRRKQREG